MDFEETVLGSESIFAGRIVHLRVDTVRLPNGNTSRREVVVHRGAVCIVPLKEDGTVLLVRQFRLPAGRALLEIPAGTLEPGEDPRVCAARELEEETGYSAAGLEPLFQAYLAPGYSTELIHAYLATGLRPGTAHPDEDETCEVHPVPLADTARMIRDGELQDSKTIAALLFAERSLQERRAPATG